MIRTVMLLLWMLLLAQSSGPIGHWIANHTYSHGSLSSQAVPTAAFTADVMRNHALLAELPGFVRLFRFPYLREGETADKRDGVRAFLRAAGYATGGVTIDGSDWYYDPLPPVAACRSPGRRPGAVPTAYLDLGVAIQVQRALHLAEPRRGQVRGRRRRFQTGMPRQPLHGAHVPARLLQAAHREYEKPRIQRITRGFWACARRGNRTPMAVNR
jgi:hypothetical protein